jgi:adiponectin receptor
MGVLYMGGLTIYILKFPERYFHGKLDYIGNSHNIWHCMIMMGAVFYYFAAMESYYQRKSLTCTSE